MNNKIDFVLTWVDGSDQEWLKERNRYQPGTGEDGSVSRYRDWENLHYWFRGVEKFAPWVNRIFFVTWGHLPSWLDLSHPKLTVVRHEEFLRQEYLPTFNINSIEMNLHRIQGLSDQFVYFNDDMFLLRPVRPEDFFKNGLPRDCCIETALVQDDVLNPFGHILMNDAALVNMHYNKREAIRKHYRKWFSPKYGKMLIRNLLMLPYKEFSSFKYTHMPSPFLKSSFQQLWAMEGDTLDRLCHNRFRTMFDVNQYVIKYWQYMEGRYEPQSPSLGRFCLLGRDDRLMIDTILRQSASMICINDDSRPDNFEEMKEKVMEAFQTILPEPSSYERRNC